MTKVNDFTQHLIANGFTHFLRNPSTNKITYFSPTKRDALGDGADEPAEDGTVHGFKDGVSMAKADENGNVSVSDYPSLASTFISPTPKRKSGQSPEETTHELVLKENKDGVKSVNPELEQVLNDLDEIMKNKEAGKGVDLDSPLCKRFLKRASNVLPDLLELLEGCDFVKDRHMFAIICRIYTIVDILKVDISHLRGELSAKCVEVQNLKEKLVKSTAIAEFAAEEMETRMKELDIARNALRQLQKEQKRTIVVNQNGIDVEMAITGVDDVEMKDVTSEKDEEKDERVARLEARVARLQNEVNHWKNEYEISQTSLQLFIAEKQKKEGIITVLEVRLEEATDAKERVAVRVAELEVRLGEVTSELETRNTELTAAKREIRTDKARIDELEENLSTAKSRVTEYKTLLEKEATRNDELQARLAEALEVNSATANGVADSDDKKDSADGGKKDTADGGKKDSANEGKKDTVENDTARVTAAKEKQRQSRVHLANANNGGEKGGNVTVPQALLDTVPGNQKIVQMSCCMVEKRTLKGAKLALDNNQINRSEVVEAVNQTMEISGIGGGINSKESLKMLADLRLGK